jgi:hypothetical protein
MLKRLDRYKWQAGEGDEESSSSESSSGENSAALLLLSKAGPCPSQQCNVHSCGLATQR